MTLMGGSVKDEAGFFNMAILRNQQPNRLTRNLELCIRVHRNVSIPWEHVHLSMHCQCGRRMHVICLLLFVVMEYTGKQWATCNKPFVEWFTLKTIGR